VAILSVERDNVIPAVERSEERDFQRRTAGIASKIGFSFRLLPSASVRVIAFIDEIKTAVVALTVGCRHFFQPTFKAVIETSYLIPTAEVTFRVEVCDHCDAAWWCWITAGDDQESRGDSG